MSFWGFQATLPYDCLIYQISSTEVYICETIHLGAASTDAKWRVKRIKDGNSRWANSKDSFDQVGTQVAAQGYTYQES